MPFDLSFVIALAGSSEPVLEQVMGLQLGERPRALPTPVAQYPGHRQFGIVVQDALGRPAQKGIGLHKAAVAVGQVQHEVVHLALHTGDDRHRLPEITLGVARRMGQRHEHLRPPPTAP